MEKNSRFMKKIISLFWGVLYSLPLLCFLFNLSVCLFSQSRIVVSLSEFNYSPFYNLYFNLSSVSNMAIQNSSSMFNFVNDSFLFTPVLHFINTIFGIDSTAYPLIFISQVICWYIMCQLLHIVIDLILLLPNICKHFLRKVGGDYE